ncbi:hypothetical protein GOODEAATRI_009373 [Goodea atripinnis]|uniref:CW-type domain-containing protein n=1 Tax=Goodea atripinnis TaxID=208336 RepID=A0ABV0N022_9TELE
MQVIVRGQKANNKGVGVIGVIECNFLDPTHNKQSFIETDKYRKTIYNLGIKLEEYWNEIRYSKTKEDPNSTIPNWAQCDECLRWRKLPDGIDINKLPDKWFCYLNPDPQFRGKRGQVVTPHSTPKRPRMNGLQLTASDTPPAGNASPLSLSTDSTEDTDDDDLVILETESTPKPPKPAGNLHKIKQEKGDGENPITMLLECSDDAAVDETPEAKAEGEASDAETCPAPGVASATTQTTASEVKQEEASQNQTKGLDDAASKKVPDQNLLKDRKVKEESGGEGDNQGEQALSNGVAHMESDEGAGPSSSLQQYSNISDVQKQQDKLLELMQDTALDRDRLEEQVKKLTSELQDKQSRLQEQCQANIKKECSHQACQTESQRDYKYLFERARQKINDLIKDKEALPAATKSETNLSSGQDEEKDIEEISLQVGSLVCELDQRNKERDELRLQIDTDMLHNEAQKVIAKEAGFDRFQEKKHVFLIDEIMWSTSAFSENLQMMTGIHSLLSLIELRQNVGRLLVSHLPELDLAQVNFECNVIDEILEQVLSGIDSK